MSNGEDVAVVVEGRADVAVDVAGLPGRHQVLAPVLDPLQRRGHLARGEHDAHVLAHRHDLLAESAAGVTHDDAHPLRGNAEQACAERAQFVRRLGGRPQGELARSTPSIRRRARASRSAPARRSADRRSHVATCAADGERLLVRRCAAHAARDVVGVGLVHHHAGANGLHEVGDRGQRLVVDVHQLDGVLGDVAALGDDECDRIPDELRLALGQRRAGGVRDVLACDRVPGLFDLRD